jgi:hypothetical protein
LLIGDALTVACVGETFSPMVVCGVVSVCLCLLRVCCCCC